MKIASGALVYAYDAVGNRLSRTSTIAAIPSTTHTYDSNDRLGTDQYDSNGSTTGSNGNSYKYDFENRLIAVNEGTPDEIRIVYDGDGNRVAKTVGGVTTRYLVDTNNLTGYAQVVEELTAPSGQPVVVNRVYTYGHDLISQTQVIDSNWITSYYGYDGHGSVCFLTDSTGAITDTYTYDAFGNMISRTGTTLNNFLYCGEQWDPDLGFYFLRARYMNPSTGRFWSMDEFEGNCPMPSSLHKYLYTGSNPVDRDDPAGTFFGGISEMSIVCALQNTLRNISITMPIKWAISGAAFGAADAYFAGEDVVEGAMKGAVLGMLLGPFSRIKILQRFLTALGTALSFDSAFEAYMEGKNALALYRGIFFVAGVKGLITSGTPSLHTGEIKVYRSINPQTGEVQYVGITNDIERRAAEHLRLKGIKIEEIKGVGYLALDDAKAVEQVLIEYYGLGKNQGTLKNIINSIAKSNPKYSQALERGEEILNAIGYPLN